MFKKIDSKIKVIAWLIFVIGLIAVLAGVIVLVTVDSWSQLIIGLIIMICSVVSVFASWILYGFGVLVEKVCNISDRIALITENKGETNGQAAESKIKKNNAIFNPFEGNVVMKIPKRNKGEENDDN